MIPWSFPLLTEKSQVPRFSHQRPSPQGLCRSTRCPLTACSPWPGPVTSRAALLCLFFCPPLFSVRPHPDRLQQAPTHGLSSLISLITAWHAAHQRSSLLCTATFRGFPGGSEGKESAWKADDLSLIPGSGRSPGGGHGNPLQDSGLQNSMDCTVHGVTKSRTWLSD